MTDQRFFTRCLYLQVRDAAADRIVTGQWKPGSAIPNENDLAREFGVSVGTVRKALDLLESEHLLSRLQGRGTFVNDLGSHSQAGRYSNLRWLGGDIVCGEVQVLGIGKAPATEAERDRLQLADDEDVYRLKRARTHKAQAFMTEDVTLPTALFPGLPERNVRSTGFLALAQTYGLLPGKGVERVSLGAASHPASKVLNIAEGAPVLCLDRLIKTLDGRPAEWRRAECLLAAMHYVATLD
jgi:GntR family transcriptional regulator